jgi:hypothetical protein
LLGTKGNTGASIEAATLFQVNATIIVGVLFFLGLSSELFGGIPEQEREQLEKELQEVERTIQQRGSNLTLTLNLLEK